MSYDQGFNFMRKNNLDIFFETSSKTGENVVPLFNRVADQLIEKSIEMENLKQIVLNNTKNPSSEKKKKGCC